MSPLRLLQEEEEEIHHRDGDAAGRVRAHPRLRPGGDDPDAEHHGRRLLPRSHRECTSGAAVTVSTVTTRFTVTRSHSMESEVLSEASVFSGQLFFFLFFPFPDTEENNCWRSLVGVFSLPFIIQHQCH